jgi:DNA-binding NarL/FixJ family response regulator
MRVIVADDMLLLREGLTQMLTARGVDVVAAQGSAEHLGAAVDRLQPDAVILDIRMPPTFTDEGLVAASQLRRQHRDVGVLVLSQYLEPVYALRLLEDAPEGLGYLLKDRVMDIAVVVDALHRVARGETVVDPTIVSTLLGRRRKAGSLNLVTQRELEVLALVAQGLSNHAIADQLRVSDRTVEAHVTQIFAKLGLDASADTHRRVLATLAYLRATG